MQEIYYFQDEIHNENKIEQSSFLHKKERKKKAFVVRKTLPLKIQWCSDHKIKNV